MTQARQSNKSTNAVIAVFIGLLIAGSLRSFGTPVRGFGDDLVMGVFSIAVLAFLGFAFWFAISGLSNLGGGGRGSGGGGVSPTDFDALKTAVDTGFTNVQTRIDAVKVDTAETKIAVGEVKAAVGRMEALMVAWTPELKDLKATIAGLLTPIGKGVGEIKKLTDELIDWKNHTWKKFADDITLAVSNVFDKVKTVDVDLNALVGAAGKLNSDQQNIAKVVDEIKKEQGLLQKSVTDGFSAVPGEVTTEVQKGIAAMQAALSKEITEVKVEQGKLQGMIIPFLSNFDVWRSSVDKTLGALPADIVSKVKGDIDAVRVAIKVETDAIRSDMVRELGGIAAKQTSVADALVLLTDAQDKMRKRLKKSLEALPAELQQVMEAQLQRVEGVFTSNIQELKAEQQQLGQTVSGLSTAAQNMQRVVLARLDAERQSIRDQLSNNLSQVSAVIERELEPIAAEMRAINGRLGEVLTQVNQQFESLGHLRLEEAERFVEAQKSIASVQSLLEKVDREGAKAKDLEEVDNNVGLILDWCSQHGPQIQKLTIQLPALGPLLDEVRKLIDELEKRQKRARDRSAEVVARQKDVFSRIQYTRHKFNHTQYSENALLFLSKLVMVRQAIDSGLTVPNMKLSITEALADISQKKDGLCTGEGSSYAQLKNFLRELNARKMAFPPDLSDELEVLTELCEPKGRLSLKLANLVRLCGLKRSTGKDVQAAIDEVISDKAWNEVVRNLTKELKLVLEKHSSASHTP